MAYEKVSLVLQFIQAQIILVLSIIFSFFEMLQSYREFLLEKFPIIKENFLQIEEIISENLNKFSKFPLLTNFIGILLIIFLVKFFFKTLLNLWNSISKINDINEDSKSKIEGLISGIALKFSFVKKEVEKQREAIRKDMKVKFQVDKFKKIEFRDQGMDDKQILHKLSVL